MGLGDIFQIVSLSRRSGTLQLTTPSRSGEIVFDQGRVVAGYMTGETNSVGDSLLELGAVKPTTYQEMLAAQADGLGGLELLRRFEAEASGISDGLDELLRRTIYQMFDWDEGTFSFVLEENPDPWRGFSLAANRVVVVKGLNPQYLAIEGARLRDERTKDDALESFLARDNKPPPQLSRDAEVKSFAAQLRESPAVQDTIPNTDVASAPIGADAAEQAVEPAVQPTVLGSPGEQTVAIPIAQSAVWPATMETQSIAGSSASAPGWCLLAVDDDPQVTHHIGDSFGSRFSEVILANTVAEAFGEMDGRDNLIVVSDLIIARSDGAGILGGIEILEKIRERSADLPVILFTDYENAEAQKKASNLGVAGFLMKPRKAQIQAVKQKGGLSPAMQEFLEGLGTALDPYLSEAGSASVVEPATSPVLVPVPGVEPATPEPILSSSVVLAPSAAAIVDLGPEGQEHKQPMAESLPYDLRREIAGYIQDVDVPGWDDLPPAVVSSEQVSTLRSMLSELVDPANRETVTLLVLRFASVVFDRAALFLVTRRFYVGLGGFSSEESSDQFVVRVRKIQVPVSTESVFSRVARFRSPYRGPLANFGGNERLVGGLGGSWPSGQVVAIPLISNDRVAAILYGDNPGGKDIGPTDTLEIFLQQAGLAMDRVLLERKLEEARRR
ncbi:MAG: hypothetical protein A2289_00775 [Deltaproteobacteria bacterium RIFOXYA12_FULL_58_15]|nr:MAG: hypothetical protein A2289_00775 [Deltaproteobacteria bacterium RIFOXYA12_FULL_58_15]